MSSASGQTAVGVTTAVTDPGPVALDSISLSMNDLYSVTEASI